MNNHFVTLSDREAFDELVKKSHEQPVVIFKHSTTCGISSGAFREMQDYNGEVALLEVQTARDLSREIENLTGVSHESPQVIVLRDGKAVWDTSHGGIKAVAIEQAVRAAGGQ
jgi:bacillithiol system protein YtxJ